MKIAFNNFLKKGITIMVISLSFASIAQQNFTLYGMKGLSQRLYLNPGFTQENRFYFALPLGNQNISFNNSGFNLNQIFEKGTDDSLMINPGNAIDKMAKRNFITADLYFELFALGFKLKRKNYFSFNATLRENLTIIYPKDLFQLINEGNGSASYLGKRANLDGLGIYNNAYLEYALGYNREINSKLTIGGRFKLISGIANVHTSSSKMGITTDAQSFDITIDGQMGIKSSNTLFFANSANSNILLNTFKTAAYDFKNFGLGLDIGGSYKLNEKIDLTASVLDIGFIKWKSNISNYESSTVRYTYDGLDIHGILFDSLNVGNHLSDTLNKVFSYETNSKQYSTSLSTRLYYGATYNLNKTFSTNALIYNQFLGSRFRLGAAVGINMHIRNWLNLSLSYSAFGRSYNNFGLGFRIKGGPFQFFIVSDNVLLALNPMTSKNAHLAFGFNINVGPMKDKDGDYVKDEKDDCPKLVGTKQFNGCPDTDNDSIIDPYDLCPELYGLKHLNGCPDMDRDSIPDKDDNCPDIAGLMKYKGCPDFDNDEIIDKEDNCPDIAGLVIFKGCPDSDGDGIKDDEDDCPQVGGSVINKGCPDSDNDGLLDFLDDCPEQYGPKENKGCPWPDTDQDGLLDQDDECPNLAGPIKNKGCPYQDSDNDGLLDADDECPGTAGPASNKGCPIIEKEVEEILKTAFNDLEFEIGKDIIKDVSFPSLSELAEVLKKKPTWGLQITGHTDNVGDDQKNLILSKKRAEAVKTYMITQGIDPTRLYALYFGETMPIASNDTPDGRQKNRRVEMKIIFK